MEIQSKSFRILSVFIFATGVLLGLVFIGIAVWGGIEAYMFDASLRAEASLTSLKCPVMITTAETGTVQASFNNPTERVIAPAVRAHISEGHVILMRQINTRVDLEPGESREITWTVEPEDAAFGRFILVRVHMFRLAPLPSRSGSCGIMVVDLPFLSGNQVVAFTLAASLTGMIVGGSLWVTGNRPLRRRTLHATKGMGFLAGSVLAGIIAGLQGWWFIGGIFFLIGTLLIVEILAYYAVSS